MARRPAAARTAFGPMVVAAVERFEPVRVVDDSLAGRFLPPALAVIARACRWRWARERLVRMADSHMGGIWAAMLCRKRYADDQVRAAFEDGVDQLLVLGAGLDTRAYRLGGGRAYEVDLPANIDTKRARVRAALGEVPDHVRLVPVDLERDDLAESLSANGFRFDQRAVIVWEGVTQYLTEDAVRHILALDAAPGSRLLFTYVRRDFLDGVDTYQAERAYRDFVVRQRLWHFGLNPDEVAPLLAEYGWTLDEQVGAAEYQARYLDPAGRRLPVSEIERFAAATRA